MKDRHGKDLRKLDREDPRYWEELLRREGLTMDAGRSKKLFYVGNSMNLDRIEQKINEGEWTHDTPAGNITE